MEKVGGKNFGEFMVIRQIRQRFPPPKFPSIRYTVLYNIAWKLSLFSDIL